MSYTGRYSLKNPKKYMGIGASPIYKSRNELVVFSKLDNDPNIVRWGYEILDIPYMNPIDRKIHKYKIDIYCEVKKNDSIQKCLIEIKQSTDLKMPKSPTLINQRSRQRYNYSMRSYIVNRSKWGAAETVCKQAGLKLMFITEKDIEKM